MTHNAIHIPSPDVTFEIPSGFVATGTLDLRSLLAGVIALAGFFAIGFLCLSLSRFDAALASVWLPNACVVAALMLARLRNELPVYAGVAVAGVLANIASGNTFLASSVFSIANLVDITVVVWLTRRTCGTRPDMTDLSQLGQFLKSGGLIGPLASALIATTAMMSDVDTVWGGASSWFLADSMGMILTVPLALLTADILGKKIRVSGPDLAERCVLILTGLGLVFLVFHQETYPLLFLVPPFTLLVAFRLGALGTAIYVPAVALVASVSTYQGFGPIVQNATSEISQMYLVQALVVANFLSGLPVAAILAGRQRLLVEIFTSKQELTLLTDTITDAVIKLDTNGICTYASPSVKDVLGRDPEAFVGTSAIESTHEDASDRIASVFNRLMKGDGTRERLTYRRLLDTAEGKPVFIEADCVATMHIEKGERDGIIVSARDVTERVELELQLTRARRTAENAAKAKSDFLANMSHEVRTPMNGVLGFAELMLQGDLNEEHKRHTEMIVQSGRSMMMLLNDILDLSKIEAGQITIDLVPTDLITTLSDCAALHQPAIANKNLELNFHYRSNATYDGENKRPWVVTDALRLRQIVLNLVGNATKFTEEGRIDVTCWCDDLRFYVEVTDTGIGISASRLKKVFAPFTQGESDTARRYGGTGLGLSISRELAELLGGKIEVESEPMVGSTFRLTLPAHYTDPVVPARRATDKPEHTTIPEGARILLVEDHDVNRILGTEMLERCGQSVAVAHDGNEAIAMVIDSLMRGSPYDLVLMDIQMPGCDGYAATRAIRAEGIGADVLPIVALTANAFPEDMIAAREAGMQAHLAKPLVFADLASILQRWLPTRIVEEERDGITRITNSTSGEPATDREKAEPIIAPSVQKSAGDFTDCLKKRADTPEHNPQPVRTAAPSTQGQQGHSPALLAKWHERRTEAVEAVRDFLADGHLGQDATSQSRCDEMARIVHKLAGTAAIFGEADLGDQAAAFERALRMGLDGQAREALAFKLLSTADNPIERRSANRE